MFCGYPENNIQSNKTIAIVYDQQANNQTQGTLDTT